MGTSSGRGALIAVAAVLALASAACVRGSAYGRPISSNDLLPPPRPPGDVRLFVSNQTAADDVAIDVLVDGVSVVRGTYGPRADPAQGSFREVWIRLAPGEHRVRVEATGRSAERVLAVGSVRETLWQVLYEEDGSITIAEIGYC